LECLIKYDLLNEKRLLSLYISKLAKDTVLKSVCVLRPKFKTVILRMNILGCENKVKRLIRGVF